MVSGHNLKLIRLNENNMFFFFSNKYLPGNDATVVAVGDGVTKDAAKKNQVNIV